MNLELVKFRDANINDRFFDSLKFDYNEFLQWFSKKADENAYIHRDNSGNINGFLYHKIEQEELSDFIPPQIVKKRLKIGTLKIDSHGTRLGERFIKKSLDYAFLEKVEEVYVTVFAKHTNLISLFYKYGFEHLADKKSKNGIEYSGRKKPQFRKYGNRET
jgi:hypothetical protein